VSRDAYIGGVRSTGVGSTALARRGLRRIVVICTTHTYTHNHPYVRSVPHNAVLDASYVGSVSKAADASSEDLSPNRDHVSIGWEVVTYGRDEAGQGCGPRYAAMSQTSHDKKMISLIYLIFTSISREVP
jgi:hypothetical protein